MFICTHIPVGRRLPNKTKQSNHGMQKKIHERLVFPWLAHGHITPFLELSKKLAGRNFQVYFCSTPVNLEPVSKILSTDHHDSLCIELVELHLPSSPELPPHYHTTNGLPPNLNETLQQTLHASSTCFSSILENLKPDLVIYDYVPSWAPALAASYDIPAIQFHTTSASSMPFPSPYLNVGIYDPYLTQFSLSYFDKLRINPYDQKSTTVVMRRSCRIQLIRSFREIEGKNLDHLNALGGTRMVSVGPIVRNPAQEQETGIEFSRWLDGKDPLSTVLVSFGSEYFCSKEELEEIANGLELSKVNFIWVVRVPKGEGESVGGLLLPDGFVERVGERGLVVDGWAPQMSILGHPSVGGFVSHCGWSSVLESMKLGVPIIAMPQHYDQPHNSKLVSSLGVGLEVRRDEHGKYTRQEIMNVIRKMVIEEDGKDLQRKARDLSQVMSNKGDEDVDEAVKELVQICNEYGKL